MVQKGHDDSDGGCDESNMMIECLWRYGVIADVGCGRRREAVLYTEQALYP